MKKRTFIFTTQQFKYLLYTLVFNQLSFYFAKIGVQKHGYKIARHKKHTSDDINWSKYWEENHPSHHFPSDPHVCPSCLTKETDFVGGHVIVNGETYILPVCRKCNSRYKYSKADKHAFYIKMEETVRAPKD